VPPCGLKPMTSIFPTGSESFEEANVIPACASGPIRKFRRIRVGRRSSALSCDMTSYVLMSDMSEIMVTPRFK